MRASTIAIVVGVAWTISFVITFLTRRFAHEMGLLDTPNERSSHQTPTPNGGGLGLVLAVSFVAPFLPVSDGNFWAVILLSLVIAAVGLRDDIRPVAASIRFAVQVLVTAGALAAIGLSAHAHPLLAALSLLGALWWINLFNFMDGIDGIAGMQAVFMLLGAAALSAWQRPDTMAASEWMLMIAIAAAVAAFLQFNWPPATIFMGDVGSTWLAYMIFLIASISIRDAWMPLSAWLILGAFFIADSTVTLLRRVVRRARWFQAHRSHAYQRLAVRVKAHRPVTLFGLGINLLWLAPMACGSLLWPQWRWAIVALAYIPLIAGALALGAGTSEPCRRNGNY